MSSEAASDTGAARARQTSTRSDGARTELPDEGSLDSVSVAQILAHCWRDERSGSLHLAHGKSERHIEIRNGSPISIDSGSGDDAFAAFLDETGQISASDRLRVEQKAAERQCPQASAVLALKLLEPKALYLALRSEARHRLAETFGWSAGSYRFGPPTTEASPSAKPHDILALLQEQLPRRWGSDRLFAAIMQVQDLYAEISPRFRKVAFKLARAGEPAARAIRQLDGTKPLGRVLGDCAGDPLAAATLWTLLSSGVLRIIDAEARGASEARLLEFDVEVELAAAPAQAVDSAAMRDPFGRREKGASKAQAFRDEIDALLGRLSDIDHYEALGLEQDASATLVKKAYFTAAKKYHPDALARLGLDELKEPAARVFARIAEAFETLSDPDKRAAYDAGAHDVAKIDTARLAQAETSFRKGEILLKMGNFDGALEYLEPAVELWPEEPAYQASLGWALFRQPRRDIERAIHHLDLAAGQAPEDALILYRLGLALRTGGEEQRASQLIARARAIDPDIGD